jgi:hypothetical protein
VLLVHLLKAKYQPEKKTGNREASIRVERKHLTKFLRESPSLRSELPELPADVYDYARIEAANETGIDFDAFPEAGEWTVAEVLESPPF